MNALPACAGQRGVKGSIPLVEWSTDVEVDAMALAAGDDHSPDKSAAVAEMRALLERKLDEMPEVFRVVFVLRSVEEMSVEETAQCLGIPEATVRSRHFRARSLLRESLARDIDLADRACSSSAARIAIVWWPACCIDLAKIVEQHARLCLTRQKTAPPAPPQETSPHWRRTKQARFSSRVAG